MRCLLLYCLIATTSSFAIAAPQSRPTLQQSAELLLSIHVNQHDLRQNAILLKFGDDLYASESDLKDWRLQIPSESPYILQEETKYYLLNELPNVQYRLDHAKQALFLKVRSKDLTPTHIRGYRPQNTAPQPSPSGGFINYDIFGQSDFKKTLVNSTVEVGYFNRYGVGTSRFIAKDIGRDNDFVRLDTTWTIDKPGKLASFRLGDGISRAGSWGRSLRFGGVQWASNFQTQPELITFPLPDIRGEANLPSTVEIYINNQRVLNSQVQPGPFIVDNARSISGLRQIQVVVRDIMGREHSMSLPFYSAPQLLKSGLHDYSYETGLVRKNFGLKSNEYDQWFASANHRFGFNDTFTGEWRGEFQSDRQGTGIGGVFLWPELGVFEASIAGSHSGLGFGELLTLGFQRQTQWLSFGGRVQFASRDYSQLGLPLDFTLPSMASTLRLGLSTDGFGNLNISHIYRDYRDRINFNQINTNYNISLNRGLFMNLSAFNSLNDDNHGVSLTFNYAFGEQSSASLTTGLQNETTTAIARAQRNLPAGGGFGYRVAAGYQDSEYLEGGVSLQNDIGTVHVDAARFRKQNNIRVSASGGIAIMDGDAYLSRRVNNGFAVVEVPDYPGVRVYAENQLVATTNEKGRALVPNLRPYQRNRIRIEHADLPMDAKIEGLTEIATPYYRSGALIKFPVRRSRSATLTIVTVSGAPLPAGATVKINGKEEKFPVALRGQVYLTDLVKHNRVRADWRGQHCEFNLSFPESNEPLPDLGRFICEGVEP